MEEVPDIQKVIEKMLVDKLDTTVVNQDSVVNQVVEIAPEMQDIPNDKIAKWISDYKQVVLFDKIAGLMYGCALGDCIGLPFEGRSTEHIKSLPTPPIVGLPQRNYRGITQGDWSDDTDQLILLMDVLTENKLNFNTRSFARKLYSWKKTGFKELGDTQGLGCGSLTGRVLSKENFIDNPMHCAIKTYKELGCISAPNGAVMRCGISAVSSDWQKTAIMQSIVTHVDARCIYSAWLVTAMCRSLFRNIIPTNESLLKNKNDFIKRVHTDEFNKYQRIYDGATDKMLEKLDLGNDEGMGYTLKALGVAFYALANIRDGKINNATDYKRFQLEIVNKGGDADTNAAISGQVLGSYLGYSKLPKDWISGLIHKKWLDVKIIKLYEVIVKL